MSQQTAVIAALTAIANRNLQVMKDDPLTIACPNAAAEIIADAGGEFKGFYKNGKARWVMLEIPEEIFPALIELGNKPRSVSSAKYSWTSITTYSFYDGEEEVIRIVKQDENAYAIVMETGEEIPMQQVNLTSKKTGETRKAWSAEPVKAGAIHQVGARLTAYILGEEIEEETED